MCQEGDLLQALGLLDDLDDLTEANYDQTFYGKAGKKFAFYQEKKKMKSRQYEIHMLDGNWPVMEKKNTAYFFC